MTKIKCQKIRSASEDSSKVRVRIIKAPIVNSIDLRNVITARARALVL